MERAARLYGAASSLRTSLRAPAGLAYRGEHERIRAEVRDALPGHEFAAAWSAGGVMSLQEAARELAGLA
jgi:hypothetical protein